MLNTTQAAKQEEQMSAEQERQLLRLKAYFPYRIVFGWIENGEFYTGAVATMHKPNKLAREGKEVWIIK
jgi:hypothetical protein